MRLKKKKKKKLPKPIKDAAPNRWTFRFPSNSPYLRILTNHKNHGCLRLSRSICKVSQNIPDITCGLHRDTHFLSHEFFLPLIVSEKISDTFNIQFKYPKIIQVTRHVQPSILCNLFSYLTCLVILSLFFRPTTLHFVDFQPITF